MFDHTGERIEPRDVLDDQELADHAAHQRTRPRSRIPNAPAPRDPHDELGYIGSTWDPSYDPWGVR